MRSKAKSRIITIISIRPDVDLFIDLLRIIPCNKTTGDKEG